MLSYWRYIWNNPPSGPGGARSGSCSEVELSLHEVEDELCPSSEEAMEAPGKAREEGEAKRKRERSTTPVLKKKKWPSGDQVLLLV